MSARRPARVRMLGAGVYVARMRVWLRRSFIIKPPVPLSLSTFSHFDNVGSCGTLLHRGSPGSQAWCPAPESPRRISGRPLT